MQTARAKHKTMFTFVCVPVCFWRDLHMKGSYKRLTHIESASMLSQQTLDFSWQGFQSRDKWLDGQQWTGAQLGTRFEQEMLESRCSQSTLPSPTVNDYTFFDLPLIHAG